MKVLYIYTVIFYIFIFICFCINKLKEFENWSTENRYVPWSILLFTCIFLSWISYPKLLNQVVVQKDSLVEKNAYEEVLGIEQNQVVHSNKLIKDADENFTYKKLGEGYGTLGDTYGALNTLFTGLAFGGLIVSIFLQMLELRATRKELAEQKDALIEQQKEFSAQTEILNKQIDLVDEQKTIAQNQSTIIDNQLIESRKQNFNNIFNTLLEERRFKIQNFKIFAKDNNIVGFDVITEYALYFLVKADGADFKCKIPEEPNVIRSHFNSIWNNYESDHIRSYAIGNYFSIMSLMFGLVEKYKDVLKDDYNFYIDMIKRIFNQHELIVFFWFALGSPGFDAIIYKYKIFEKLPHTPGMEYCAHKVFRVEAFGNNANWNDGAKKN